MLTKINLPNGLVNGPSNVVGGGNLFTTGKVFYVDSTTGSDGNVGEDPNAPKATLDGAITAARANKGDIIILMPNHAENVADATTFQVDKAGLSIVGLGHGRNRPTFTFTGTAGSVEIDSADTLIDNIVFLASVTAVVVGMNVDADDVTVSNCEFNWDATGDDFVTMIDVDTVSRFNLLNCDLIAEEGAAGCEEAIRLDTAHDVVISGNRIIGDFTDGAIIGEGAAGRGLQIIGNTIYNADTTAGFLVDLNVAFTGIMANNWMGTLFATAPETAVDPGSLLSTENYVCNAVDESGALVPVTVST